MTGKPVVGLIGGIGSGKSQVAAAFARRGARVISGDELGHEALGQAGIRQQVIERWGTSATDENGTISRPKLGAIVFTDPAERAALEAIVHPWIERRMREQIDLAAGDETVPLVLVDAAILLEAGWDDLCDQIIYVDAPRELRLSRLAEQRGWSAQDVEAREAAQMPLAEKRGRADAVVVNAGSLEEVSRQVDELLGRWSVRPRERASDSAV